MSQSKLHPHPPLACRSKWPGMWLGLAVACWGLGGGWRGWCAIWGGPAVTPSKGEGEFFFFFFLAAMGREGLMVLELSF